MGPPYALVRGGWKRDTVKIGDRVTVEAAALAKDGRMRRFGTDDPDDSCRRTKLPMW